MRTIAFIHENFPFGGAEVVTKNVITSLSKRGYKSVIFAHKIKFEQLPSLPGVEYVVLPYKITKSANIPLILSKIEEMEIDVLVSKDFINPLFVAVKQKEQCKVVFCEHSMPFWKMLSGKENAKRTFKKWMEWYCLRSIKYKISPLSKMYKKIYDLVDAFGVLCDDYGREFAKELNLDYDTSKFVTLTNAAYPNSKVNKTKNREVCFIGRLSYADKRVDRLLRVWALIQDRYPEWVLKIIGDGKERLALEELSQKLGLKNIEFAGHISDIQKCYDSAAIVPLTSTFEGWPMAMIEAQSNGCATIAFDVCAGVREILSPSWENGVLVPPFNINMYAESLSRLMSDEELRNRIAENGRKHVSEFSEDKTAEQWTNMIENLLS